MWKIYTPIIALLILLGAGYQYGTVENYEVIVNSKERVCSSNDCSYMVYTDKGVFKNKDTIFYLKWNSADIHGELKEGSKYQVKTYGWRFGFLSMFENIVSIQEK